MQLLLQNKMLTIPEVQVLCGKFFAALHGMHKHVKRPISDKTKESCAIF